MSDRLSSLTVVVPVKSTRRGKSRLDLPERRRSELALAMALDTVAAVAEVCRVLVVVDDPDTDGRALAEVGARVLPTGVTGLNEVIAEGLAMLAGDPATSNVPAGVLPGDLPGLRSADLAAAVLAWQPAAPGVVADRDGTGTTLLLAARPDLLRPRYGLRSFDRHRAAGAAAIEVPLTSSLRRDVDLLADLDDPVGPRSAAVLAGWRRPA